jgi:glycosyltransferase involved in cell wall biosynthesis
LLWLFGFRYAIWLVHDREEALRSEMNKRSGLVSLIGRALNRLTGLIERASMRSAIVVANGNHLATQARAAGLAADRVLQIVSSTLSARDMPDIAPRRLGRHQEIRLLYVGRIAAEKGLGDLIEALRLLSNTPGNKVARLTIVGWDSQGEGERIRRLARALNVRDQIDFLGHVEYGPALFQQFVDADLFVLPSHAEGTPRVLVEAMAFGLPIVATNVGGISDVVRDGSNGYLVQPHSPQAIADRIRGLATNPEDYSRISSSNVNCAKQLLVETVAEGIARFLRRHGFRI